MLIEFDERLRSAYMARTYVPGLRIAIDGIRRYIGRYSKQLEKNSWSFLWALAEFLLDLAEIMLAVIEAQTPLGEAYDPDILLDSSPYINQVQGAFEKFMAQVSAAEGA